MIPVWMVVSGSILLFMLISSIASRINNLCCRCGLSPREQPGWNALERLYCTIISVLGCFSVAWFIAGKLKTYDATWGTYRFFKMGRGLKLFKFTLKENFTDFWGCMLQRRLT